MEIERKWLVNGWPTGLHMLFELHMRQGYLCVSPTVRIREEADPLGDTEHILCFKTGKGIVRNEVEFPIERKHFEEIEKMIGLPLIPKLRRTYQLGDGLRLEVSHVDEGMPTEFWYAEIEFPTEEAARSFSPEAAGLGGYLVKDVSEEPGQTMGAFWVKTRLSEW